MTISCAGARRGSAERHLAPSWGIFSVRIDWPQRFVNMVCFVNMQSRLVSVCGAFDSRTKDNALRTLLLMFVDRCKSRTYIWTNWCLIGWGATGRNRVCSAVISLVLFTDSLG
jgi:hypothetical protein